MPNHPAFPNPNLISAVTASIAAINTLLRDDPLHAALHTFLAVTHILKWWRERQR